MKNLLFVLIFLSLVVSCKKEAADPCAGITCVNGGTCVNGDCNCPPMWTGANCSEQKTPAKIFISSIFIKTWPLYAANGVSWDIGNAPDIYLTVTVNGIVAYDGTANRFVNTAGASGILGFSANLLINPYDQVELSVYDYDDFDADDYMGGVQGLVYNSTNGFPAIRTFQCAGCASSFDLNLEYRY